MAGALGTLSMGAGPAPRVASLRVGGVVAELRLLQLVVDVAGNPLSSELSHVLFLLPGTVSPKRLPCWPLVFQPSPKSCPCREAFSDHQAQAAPLPLGLFPISNDIISLFMGLLSLPQPECQSSVSLICFFISRT